MKGLKNDLNMDIGKLLALKMFNRDYIAEKLDMPRSNLIAALKGRRSLPMKYFSPLVELLGLDNKILLRKDMLHVLTLSNIEKQFHHCYDVIYIFLESPIEQVAILDIIDDKLSSMAYVFKDKRNTYLILRDDEKLLSYADEKMYPDFPVTRNDDIRKLFNSADYPLKREVSLSSFQDMTTGKISVKEFTTFLSQKDETVWTWQRIRKEAESKGISPNDIAKALKLNS